MGTRPYTDSYEYYGRSSSLMGLGPTHVHVWGFSLISLSPSSSCYHLALFFSLSFWLRSRSPLAHFELLYIYNRQTGRLHIPKGDLDQYVQIFIPNDCTFGLFRLLPVRQITLEENIGVYWLVLKENIGVYWLFTFRLGSLVTDRVVILLLPECLTRD